MTRQIRLTTRKELVKALRVRYRSAAFGDRIKILDEFVALTGYHRKHAIRAQRPDFSLAAHGGLSLRAARFLSLCLVDQIGLARLLRLPPPVRQVVELLQRLVLQDADDHGLFLGRQPLIQRRPRATLRRKAGSTAIRFRPATER